jgi:hypothetical protein
MLMSNGNMVIVLHHCLSQKTELCFLVVSGRGRGEESWPLGLIPSYFHEYWLLLLFVFSVRLGAGAAHGRACNLCITVITCTPWCLPATD